MKFEKTFKLLFAVLSGLLLGFAWIPSCTFLIFFAFIPFFLNEKSLLESDSKKKTSTLFWLSYLTFFTWNLSATWWVGYASLGGASMAISCNALLMSLTYLVYLLITKNIKSLLRYFLFLPVWLGFEYLHTDWDLSWTWLTLGNVFAFETNWIQWYEFTGVSGGSFWVLLINAFVFILIFYPETTKTFLRKTTLFACLIALFFLPILISHGIKPIPGKTKNLNRVQCLILQPGYNPYTEKFEIPFVEQFSQTMKLAQEQLDSTIDYLILPETFIPHQFIGDDIFENNIDNHPYLRLFFDSLLQQFPKLHIVTGADTHYQYGKNETHLPTSRKYSDTLLYYEAFNTALQLRHQKPIDIYHKSKLVPGVEMMPFPTVFGLLSNLAIEMGGSSGSLGRQTEREVFAGPGTAKAGAVICYESVFGEYVTEYVKKGANILFILTNDGWWEDTPGYHQHLAYAGLRAIETRRWIARSANTGISAVINPAGEIEKSAGWYEKTALKAAIPILEGKTFYVRNGDLISKIALVLTAIITASSFIPFLRRFTAKK